MNRRGFLFGSVAVPVGAVLPPALAEELALPPPKLTPETRLIVPSMNRGAVMHMRDLMEGRGRLTILDDDGGVVGTYQVVRVTQRCQPIEYVSWVNNTVRAVRGPAELSMEFVQTDWE